MNISSIFAKGKDFASSIARKTSNTVHKNPISDQKITKNIAESAVDSFESSKKVGDLSHLDELFKKLSTSKTSSELWDEYCLLEEQSDKMMHLGKIAEANELCLKANAKFKEYSEAFDKESQLEQFKLNQESKAFNKMQSSQDNVGALIHKSQVESVVKTNLEYKKILEAKKRYSRK